MKRRLHVSKPDVKKKKNTLLHFQNLVSLVYCNFLLGRLKLSDSAVALDPKLELGIQRNFRKKLNEP